MEKYNDVGEDGVAQDTKGPRWQTRGILGGLLAAPAGDDVG